MRIKPKKAAEQTTDRKQEEKSANPMLNEVEEAKEGNQTGTRQKSINSINELYIEVLYHYKDCV